MHLRPANPTDFSSTASISVNAFWNDELYEYTNIWREQYPDHFRDSFLRRHRLRYWAPGYIFHVAVTDEGDDGHLEGGKVVGYAIWERRGTSAMARKWQAQTWWAFLEEKLCNATEKYTALLHLDKSLNYNRLNTFLSQTAQDFPTIPELWKLQNLCVHPDFQRRGIGSLMIKWGQEQAEKEGCPIGLESSMVARKMYVKNGFRMCGYMHIEGFPLDDAILIWEPNGMEGRWGMQEG